MDLSRELLLHRAGEIGENVDLPGGVTMGRKEAGHFVRQKGARVALEDSCHEVLRQGARPQERRARDRLGLSHPAASKLDRQGRLLPLVLGETGHTQNLSHHAMEVLIELGEGWLENVRRARPEQMISRPDWE